MIEKIYKNKYMVTCDNCETEYTSANTAEGCIYCGHKELKKMEALELEEGEGMREIKFRGKRLDNGEWVYGFLIQYENGWYICNFIGDAYQYEVDPSTVGRFTGLKDKNRKEIYEGDIVIPQTFTNAKYRVYWSQERLQWSIINTSNVSKESGRALINNSTLYEVIGNIYENPELLKGD